MTDPISFPLATSRHGLPLLFVAQAHKEIIVNEALARLDALLHPVVEAQTAAPPQTAADGQCWLVGPGASGAWAGQEDALAVRSGEGWQFLPAQEGMWIFDRDRQQWGCFSAGWHFAPPVAGPGGGTSPDPEARAALAALVSALQMLKILP